MHRVRYTQTADDCFRALTPDQRRAIIRIVANIQVDPAPDNWVKITYEALGAMYALYLDHLGHWVLYHVEGDLVTVVAVGVGDFYVPLPRSD